MNSQEFTQQVHLLIHSVRLISNYKSSELERKISRLVIEYFKDCKECQEVATKIKNQPVKKGFLQRLGDVADAN